MYISTNNIDGEASDIPDDTEIGTAILEMIWVFLKM